jgi:hypothetical protein
MNKGDKTKKDSVSSDDVFERDVFSALVHNLNIVPETPEEVLKAEQLLKEAGTSGLPDHLRNPESILKRIKAKQKPGKSKILFLHANLFAETGLELQRAARKGKSLSSSIEEKMRKNREKATHQHPIKK